MNMRKGIYFLFAAAIALSTVDFVEGSRLKRTRRSIENADDSETNDTEWSPRRRLTMADDVFTGTSREFEVVGFHRAAGVQVIKIIGKFFKGIGSLIHFTLNLPVELLRSFKERFAIEEPEPEPVTTMSAIYDSISSVMSGSTDPEPVPKQNQPRKTVNSGEQKSFNKSAPLRRQQNLPKASSRGGALGGKSIMEDLARGGSSSAFDSEDSAQAVAIPQDFSSYLPSASRLAGLLPTLVAGLVFTTAGTIVGYLWSYEWKETANGYMETANDYMDYFFGESEGKAASDAMYDVPTDSMYDTTASTSSAEVHDDTSSSSTIPVTPDRF